MCAGIDLGQFHFPYYSRFLWLNWFYRESRIDHLEKKVDNLVSQLAKVDNSRLALVTEQRPECSWQQDNTQVMENGSSSLHSSYALHIRQEGLTTKLNVADDFVSRGLLTLWEADELLSKFQEHKMHHFPFVIIPKGVNASALRRKCPFLLLCIMTACLEHDPTKQGKLESEIRKVIGTSLIMEMRRNMDLLQGLLVHIAWYHYHWRTYHTQAYMLLQIAIMLVVDLGLDKDENFKMQAIPPDGKESDQAQEYEIHQTPSGQRALLGCYYLCSK